MNLLYRSVSSIATRLVKQPHLKAAKVLTNFQPSRNWSKDAPPNQSEMLFDLFKDSNEKIQVGNFLNQLHSHGFKRNDPRIKTFIDALTIEAHGGDVDPLVLDEKRFTHLIQDYVPLFVQAFQNDYVISDFAEFCRNIQEIYWKCKDDKSGNVADYIPQLKKMSPHLWGVSICTVDGQRFSIGDTQVPFTIQSTGKPISYGIALAELGSNTVHKYVGQEPSGRRFNKLVLDQNNKPHNPMVNAGAIVVCSLLLDLVNGQMSPADKFEWVKQYFKKMAGGEYLGFCASTFLSEKESADRNFAIGYYLKGYNCFPSRAKLNDVLDLYFQLCSLEVNADSLAVIGATLANGGFCPTTREQAMTPMAVRDVLALMHSCGMYDYSGQFAFNVGLPTKSGVSGSVMVVIPNVMGITCFSPPLDLYGNSARGVLFCEELVRIYNFHQYDNLRHSVNKLDPRKRTCEVLNDSREFATLLFAVENGDLKEVKRKFLAGMDMNRSDYDGRTAMHIAASQGHYYIVEFLLNICKANPNLKDRWENTPMGNATQFGHKDVIELLSAAEATADAE